MSIPLTVGQLAACAGVSADTIRYYERLGVVPKASRTAAGYRQYPESTVARIVLVRNAQRFGFSLQQIGGFLRVREQGGKPCHEVRGTAQRLLEAVDRQIAELTAAREQMRNTLQHWDARLANTPSHLPARLLETLALPHAIVSGPARRLQARVPGKRPRR